MNHAHRWHRTHTNRGRLSHGLPECTQWAIEDLAYLMSCEEDLDSSAPCRRRPWCVSSCLCFSSILHLYLDGQSILQPFLVQGRVEDVWLGGHGKRSQKLDCQRQTPLELTNSLFWVDQITYKIYYSHALHIKPSCKHYREVSGVLPWATLVPPLDSTSTQPSTHTIPRNG